MCETCAGLVTEYRAVVGLVPAGLEPVAPPEAAWGAIQAAARARRRSGAPSMLGNWLRVARWPAVAVAVAVLVAWNVTLQRELTRRAPGPAPGPEVEALSRRPGRIVILQGTGKPGASARIFVAVDGGGHLAVSGLDPLPQGRTTSFGSCGVRPPRSLLRRSRLMRPAARGRRSPFRTLFMTLMRLL
jgi:hypothetical protein